MIFSPPDVDTIAAVASAPGVSSQAVIRLSGPRALAAISALVAEGGAGLEEAPGFRGRAVVLDVEGARIPAWMTLFRAPRSYTREDVVEILVPGSGPLLGALMRALVSGGPERGAGARWARPGEFTQRAFLNGRLDLSQAESVASLIAAGGEEEARASRRALRGELRERLERLASGITETLALIEAALDFPDEDLPQVSAAAVAARLEKLCASLADLRACSHFRLIGGDALRVVLAGFPNAGKSSLLNAILERDAAIVAGVPGTTRDPVRALAMHGGMRVEWIDLAGTFSLEGLFAAEESPPATCVSPGAGASGASDFGVTGGAEDPIWEVVRRLTGRELRSADRVLWVVDPTAPLEPALGEFRRLPAPQKTLVVQKIDLLDAEALEELRKLPEEPLLVSARLRLGVEDLIERVTAAPLSPGGRGPSAVHRDAAGDPPVFLLSSHQDAALSLAEEALERARDASKQGLGHEYAASDLRDALRALEDLTGRVTPDVILEHVFSKFCIGK